MSKRLEVATGLILRGDMILLCQRSKTSSHALKWEFPGGKVEDGETPEQALRRELQEELSIEAKIDSCVCTNRADYADGGLFRVYYYIVRDIKGELTNNVFEDFQWVHINDVKNYDVLEGNRTICKELPRLIAQANDEHYMYLALNEAEIAASQGEVPVGAVIVRNGEIVGKGHNTIEQTQNVLNHAELNAIRMASETIGHKRLLECTMYVTLEPCSMCAGAIVLARIPRVVFGADDPKTGGVVSINNILSDTRLNHQCSITRSVLNFECGFILKQFFANLRKDA
ncbi:MAG: NUDIX domain-containing protein [Candidatus Kapabacteria bacterium]|nr:NUDIX domain-containing protein [Candidatus Kapabacteria bacterium]